MIKILDKNFKKSDKILNALITFPSISIYQGKSILTQLNMHVNGCFNQLLLEDIHLLENIIQQYPIYNIKNIIQKDINLLKEIKCNRGIRMIRGLPVRGQRTHTNGRTQKMKIFPEIFKNKK